MRNHLIFFLLCPFFIMCQSTLNISSDQNLPNDVKWVTSSNEYIALCEQIYATAYRSLNDVFQQTKKPVIIMDLDETVLDNSQYQVELSIKKATYNEATWNQWVNKESAELVPGAKDFILQYKKYKHARIIYISNRNHITLEATKNNMKQLGIYFEDDIFLLRKNKADTKVVRRKEVFNGTNRMSTYGPQKVLAYFGDAMGDFPIDSSYKFSINKFIFPNPMYGKW